MLRGRKQNTGDGFTLLELLVVISVVSLLMAIILPALGRVKEMTRSLVCRSNQRQLTLAWHMYAMDNSGKLCAAETCWNGVQPWDGEDPHLGADHFWVSDGPGMPYNEYCGTEAAIKKGAIWPYVENVDVYHCDSDPTSSARSYGISQAMGGVIEGFGEKNFKNISQVSMPSQKLVFIEVALQATGDGDREGVGISGGVRPIDTYSKDWRGDMIFLTYRHMTGCNFSFADGHVEPWKWKDNRSVELMDGLSRENQLAEATIDNVDIGRLLPLVRGLRDRQW